MIAGREFDALVAEKVMGWKPLGTESPAAAWEDGGDNVHTWEDSSFPSFRPSTDIAAVGLVEDEIERRELRLEYVAYLIDQIVEVPLNANYLTTIVWIAMRATPFERCRAALKSVGADLGGGA